MARSLRGRGGPGLIQWTALGAAALVILGLTFALGVLVGRHWVRQVPLLPAVAADDGARKPAAAGRRAGLAGPDLERVPRIQDKLTFYETLTAPLKPPPAASPATGATAEGRRAAPAGEARTEDKPRAAAGARDDEGETWSVQVAALGTPERAEGLRKLLAEAGFRAHVVPTRTDDGQTRYRVRIGRYETREEAARAAERLRAERRLSAFVTSD